MKFAIAYSAISSAALSTASLIEPPKKPLPILPSVWITLSRIVRPWPSVNGPGFSEVP